MIFLKIMKRKIDLKNTLLFFTITVSLTFFIKYEMLKIKYNRIKSDAINSPVMISRNINSPMLFIGGSPRFDLFLYLFNLGLTIFCL